ncbi:uncharacterized protein [Montipora capricornis]|uniref:uncharacterized protein n=1 Tax=Montipora capricornis TaxID=246305 RepID=UPI0035F1D66F
MTLSTISVTLFVVAALSTSAEARSEESLVLRVFNPDYHPSDEEMLAILRKADLESHGYTKELTTSLTSRENITNLTYEKRHFYYRTVDCSRAQEVAQELETLLPDAYEVTLRNKVYNEIKARNLANMKKCKVGVEVHFKNGGGCKGGRKRSKRDSCDCWICIIIKSEE